MSPPLGRAEAALVTLGAALASRDAEALDRALHDALDAADAAHVEEVLLQSYLFVGYPIALEALARWRDVSGLEAGPPSDDDDDLWAERGERICQSVYGGQYERLRANVQRLHPDMEQWMVVEGYGKVLGRDGPELWVRELCIAAVLAVLDSPRQLYSHLRGALNVGASAAAVEDALERALGLARPEAGQRARQTWAAVRARPPDA